MPRHATSRHATSRHFSSRHATSRYSTSCHATSRHATSHLTSHLTSSATSRVTSEVTSHDVRRGNWSKSCWSTGATPRSSPGSAGSRVHRCGGFRHRSRVHEQNNSKVSNGLIRYVKQTEILTHATHVNGPRVFGQSHQVFR